MSETISFAGAPGGGGNQAPERGFEEVAHELSRNAESVVRYLLPGGAVRGSEYVIGDLHGGRGDSLSISIAGNKAGVWRDFATGDGGGDLIALWSARYGIAPLEAKREAEKWLGLASIKKGTHKTASPKPSPNAADGDPMWWRSIKPKAKWDYFDSDGRLFACVYRFEHPQTGKKEIRPWNPVANDGVGAWEVPKGERPLLNLPDIINRSGPVVLVEGEKCADAIQAIGMIATTVMGGAQAVAKTDWSPLEGRDVILWPDNDPAGRDWLNGVTDHLREAGALSARVVKVPNKKPLKWDAADATDIERSELIAESQKTVAVVTGVPRLQVRDWAPDCYAGKPKKQDWLVRETFPSGSMAILAARGDTGKGMMLLDLGLKVSGGDCPRWDGPVAFGHTVTNFGKVVILSAEDDHAEIHRRLHRLDPDGVMRAKAGNNFMAVPFPNLGGTPALIESTGRTINITDAWKMIRDQLLEIDNLALIVIDPLSAFIRADLNTDAAAIAYVGTTFAALASETGACLIAAHHMRKGQANKTGNLPEQARDEIRGGGGIVDGARLAYALWPATETEAKRVLKLFGTDPEKEGWQSRVVEGAVVKGNGLVDREKRTYVRDPATGLLIDRTPDLIKARVAGPDRDDLYEVLVAEIAKAAKDGQPFTLTKADGLYDNRHRLPPALRNMGRDRIQDMARELLEHDKIRKCVSRGSRTAKWLDVEGGIFDIGEGEVTLGGQEAAADD